MKLPTIFEDLTTTDLRPMTKNEAAALSIAVMQNLTERRCGTPKEIIDRWNKMMKGEGLPDNISIILSRIAGAMPETILDESVVIWAGSLAKRPGECVMWAYAIVRETAKNDGVPIRIDHLVKNVFPWGVPRDEYYHKRWLEQKRSHGRGHSDNWLDVAEVYKTGEIPV